MKTRISQTNLQVKQAMYNALLTLINEKPFSSISVSDITSKAEVSRMAFYRNYQSMEEILIERLNEIVEEYKIEEIKQIETTRTTHQNIFYEKKYILHCFQFFYEHRKFINALIASGMGDLFLAKITKYLIQKWIDKENDTRNEVLKISAYAGSIYNMYREWSQGEFQESPEDVAEILYDLIKG